MCYDQLDLSIRLEFNQVLQVSRAARRELANGEAGNKGFLPAGQQAELHRAPLAHKSIKLYQLVVNNFSLDQPTARASAS